MQKIKQALKKNTFIWVVVNNALRIQNYLAVTSRSPKRTPEEPTLIHPQSQLVTAWQLTEPIYYSWCTRTHCHARLHRKKWEFAYILQCLDTYNMITPGKRGLAFGCGQEPIPALLAKHGCSVLATDLDFETAQAKGWVNSKEHAASAAILNKDGICPEYIFSENVSFRIVNMNAIPDDLQGFDFLWSSCALEHLGSLNHGLEFIKNAMNCLKPGGVAVHTTEFTFSSDADTLETPELSIYRKQDMLKLQLELESEGHYVAPFNWSIGSSNLDKHIDLPPYSPRTCLRLRHHNFDCTSIGLIIRKSE